MLQALLWIVVCYGSAIAAVHAAHALWKKNGTGQPSGKHYILVTNNSGQQVEWVFRALAWYVRMKGIGVKITVLDEGSHDDTIPIVERIAANGDSDVAILYTTDRVAEDSDESSITVRLNHREDWSKLPCAL